ncbi:MAG: hypothetical protein GY754_08800 [bacterium]|nr:hypothetical protein [bacterium]
MNRFKIFLVSIFFFFSSTLIFAQTENNTTKENSTYRVIPTSLAILPIPSPGKTIHNFSLSFFGDYRTKLDGCSIGSGIDITTEDASGVQFSSLGIITQNDTAGFQASGLFNFTGRNMGGAQAAGLFNYSGNNTTGFQGAGLFNYSGNNTTGFQGAGLLNYSGNNSKGFQGAGLFNYSGNNRKGFQGAGLFNIAQGNFSGSQMAGLFNYTGEKMIGVQAGIINISKSGEGLMLGLINISDDLNGAPIGLINIIKNSELHGEIWWEETNFFKVALKQQLKNLNLIYVVGVDTVFNSLSFGFGYGAHIPIEKFYIDIDILANSIYPSMKNFNKQIFHAQTRLILGYKILERFAIFAGASYNYSTNFGENTPLVKPLSATYGSENHAHWPGFFFGVQI